MMNSNLSDLLTGARCKHCDKDLVWVEKETVSASKDLLKSNFKTLGALQTIDEKKCHPICPQCDAYGLGIELEESLPVITQAGWVTNVHMLNLWSESSINKERDALLVKLKDCILRHKSAAEDDDVGWWDAENQALSSLFSYLRKHSVLNVNPDLLTAIDEDGFSDHATEVAELLEQQADALPEADRVLVTGLFKSLWSS
jgi:hypothetical protein